MWKVLAQTQSRQTSRNLQIYILKSLIFTRITALAFHSNRNLFCETPNMPLGTERSAARIFRCAEVNLLIAIVWPSSSSRCVFSLSYFEDLNWHSLGGTCRSSTCQDCIVPLGARILLSSNL
jgi:hypothetical protein